MRTKYTITCTTPPYAAVVLTHQDVIQKLQREQSQNSRKAIPEAVVNDLKNWLANNQDSPGKTKSIEIGKNSYLVGVIPMEHVYKPRKKEE